MLIRARSQCAIFSGCDCDSSYCNKWVVKGLNASVYTTRLRQHYQLLSSSVQVKTNRSRNQKKTHSVNEFVVAICDVVYDCHTSKYKLTANVRVLIL